MGVIQKLIGGIFAFLGGFLKGLLGIVGIGKKSEYFLELEDASSKSETKAVAPAPAKPEPAKVEPVKAVTPPQPAPSEPVKAEPVKAESLNGKTSAAPASNTPPTFAPNFLTTASSNGRRRPGPSLNRYMDMARQVKPSA
ncbi:hypothetical protein H6G89_09980 [Oscillatoria sp. FACHB-1407]|uniref:hypothetical protein n=1 Tax=Oscillatoria sp. FACHB-1407 TaxID=2692847 RepID=UPI0016826D71|nr:hypothetical protein [Oscillatoria sp. FACHB-1407]MBD2461375.1 hypothetical protein [Oscillatoria sp. FACHB-1407]